MAFLRRSSLENDENVVIIDKRRFCGINYLVIRGVVW